MCFIFFNRLENVADAAFVIVVSVTLESGLLSSPGNDDKVHLNTLFHVNLDIVFFGVNVVDYSRNFDFVVFETVLYDTDLVDLFEDETIFYQLLRGDCFECFFKYSSICSVNTRLPYILLTCF